MLSTIAMIGKLHEKDRENQALRDENVLLKKFLREYGTCKTCGNGPRPRDDFLCDDCHVGDNVTLGNTRWFPNDKIMKVREMEENELYGLLWDQKGAHAEKVDGYVLVKRAELDHLYQCKERMFEWKARSLRNYRLLKALWGK